MTYLVLVLLAVIGIGVIWLAAVGYGRRAERESQAKKRLEDVRKARDIQVKPDINWSDWVAKLRSKNKL